MIRIAAMADNHITERETVAGRVILGPDGRNVRGSDRERCLNAVIDGAIERQVDLLVDAGDLFDSSRPTPAEYVIVERALDRACEHFPVICVGCNHGLPQSPLEQHALAPLIGRHPDLHIELSPTVRTKAGPIQIACLPWPRRSILATDEQCAGLSQAGVNALISEKLKGVVRMLLSQAMNDIPTILAGHITLREAVFDSGRGPDLGAILLSAEDFSPFAATILGDIHRSQSFGREGRIFYTGSTDRQDFGEEQNTPGWWLVTLDNDRFSKEFIQTPARVFSTLTPHLFHTSGRSRWDPDAICRVKGEVSQEDYDQMQPLLAHWRANPLFSEELEVTRTTRVRSEAMGKSLTDEEALREWCVVNGREGELQGLLEEHRGLAKAKG